jgi:2-phospho-L-lactate transferase/gluconeogenesis factor (CofD/UPF0052 family)
MNDNVLRTVVFSGGRGTKSIQQSLSGVNNTKTTYVINGYDSGLSTGEVRRSVGGLLGPSDFRKAIVNIASASANADAVAAAKVLDFRLPIEHEQALSIFNSLENEKFLMRYLSEISPEISLSIALDVYEKLVTYKRYLSETALLDAFSPSDLAIGNAFIAGAFIEHSDFQIAIDSTLKLIGLGNNVAILNVTQGEDLWLTAVSESGLVCVEEGHFVTTPPPDPICDLLLISRDSYLSTRQDLGTWNRPKAEQLELLMNSNLKPMCNNAVISAIAEADLIIYGTGTLHSSLLPTYMTNGLTEAIANNQSAKKILMVNGVRDVDIHQSLKRETALDSTLRYLNPAESCNNLQLLSEVWVTSRPWDEVSDCLSAASEYKGFPISELQGTDDSEFGASNSYMAISSAMARTLGSRLAPSEFVTSIVIPVLNEVTKLEGLFSEIDRFTHTANGSLIEYIFVDGGSTDGSVELLNNHSGSVHLQLEGNSGRQSAVSHGVERSRGSVVGVFHSDLEYSIESFMSILGNAERNKGTLYVASRTHGAGNELNLKKVYGSRNANYWISRIGGIAVGTFLSIRIGRVVSDPLSGVYAGEREMLISTSPDKGEVSGYVKLIRNCAKSGVPIVEMGIAYKPRKKQDGKKTSVGHGIRALIAALI